MTHKQAVLKLLSDRKPHTHRELYAIGCVAHSRVSDLRSDGYVIDQWREGGHYLYRLVGERLGGTAASPDSVRDGTDGSTAAPPSTPSNPTGRGSAPLSPALSSWEPHPRTRDGGVLELVFDEHDQATLWDDAA